MQISTALAATAAATLTLAALTTVDAQAAPSPDLVISEAYGGGGNSGATLTNDFVELQARTTTSLDGYSVQYLSSAATGTWQATPLSKSIPAQGHYLVQEAKGSGGTDALPTPDATGSINMSGSAGTVALVHGTAPLTCATAAACTSDPKVVDLVGYGPSTVVREGSPAPATSNAQSVQRTGADTDDNAADFTAATPTPANAGTTSGGGTTPGPLRIHDIQGASWVSPSNGDAVTNVPGIVTAVRTTSSKGFWLQDPTPDDNPATSEGVYVFTGSTPTVKPGDSVLVSGTVQDYYPLSGGETLSSTSNLSTTEITKPTVTALSSGNALPAPVVLKQNTVPDLYAPDLGGGNIEKTPITPTRSALDFYESVEGMRVEVDNAPVVGPSNSYGEQYVTTKPKTDRTYRGGAVLTGDNRTPPGRLEVATLDGSKLALDVGDVLRGATVGPIDWSAFGGYTLQASALGTPVDKHLQPVVATKAGRKQLSIATYNVENLAATDPDSKFAALGAGIVTNLATPDVISLEEIQDNDGATDDGVVASNRTLDKLVDAVIAAGGPHYDYRVVNPVDDKDGGQPGGNIRIAFLYNPARTVFVDAGSPATDRSTTGTAVTKSRGKPALTLSPGRIDPTNPVWTDSRKPLVGQFRFDGTDVFVIANHFDSKGGDQNADGRFQYPKQSSATQRAGQALVVHNFVDDLLAVDPQARAVVLGDLNDYQFSPAVSVLKTGHADGTGRSTLTDLITTLPISQQYTYVYNGVSQVLDHILTTKGVRRIDYQVVHVNSEYHDQVSDHDPQELAFTP